MSHLSGISSSSVSRLGLGNAKPSFGQALKQSWADTFAKSKALGALRVVANLTGVGALIDLAVSGIAHSLGKLGQNAQKVTPSRLAQSQSEPLTHSHKESVSEKRVQSEPKGVTPWKPTKDFGISKKDLETSGVLSPPSRPQSGVHALHTMAFQAFFKQGVSFPIPSGAKNSDKLNGKVTIDGKEYDYSATGKLAKGSGAGIWMVQLTSAEGGSQPTEFVIKSNPKKWDDSDQFMLEFSRVGRQKDLTEVQVLDHMSGNDHALQFHGGYSMPDGTLVYGMEKAQGDMLSILDTRIDAQNKGTLLPSEADQHLLEMGQALRDLHATGQVHGDVKADNFMLGSDGTARIADFGECHVMDPSVRDETLKGDVERFASMAFNVRYGLKETTHSLATAIKSQQSGLEEEFTLKLSSMIDAQKQLISQMEKEGGEVDLIKDMKRQLQDLEDPAKMVDAMIEISGGDLDEATRSYAINDLLLRAVETPKPGFDYMNRLTTQLAKLVQ